MESTPGNTFDLFDAYRRTNYLAQTPLGEIRLRVGVMDKRLGELLERFKSQNWAFISAFNPGSLPLTVDENMSRQRRIEEVLRQEDWTFFPGEGVGDDGLWPAEHSVLVLGIDRARAVELAREFGQNAILAGDESAVPELVDCRD